MLKCMHCYKHLNPFCWCCVYKNNVSSPFVQMNPQNPCPYKTIIRSRATSGASWWQAYVFDPCGTYMPFINTCLLEEHCTAAAS